MEILKVSTNNSSIFTTTTTSLLQTIHTASASASDGIYTSHFHYQSHPPHVEMDDKPSSVLMEEVVMKRRLVIDGSNNDRRLAALTKRFVSFCDSDDEPPDVGQMSLARLLTQLRQVEFDVRKTYVEILKTEEAKEMYEAVQKDLQSEIQNAKKSISATKKNLFQIKKHEADLRKAEAMVRLLSEQPDPKSVLAQLDQSNKDLMHLKEKHKHQQILLKTRIDAFNIFAGVFDILEEILKKEDRELSVEANTSVEISSPEIDATVNESANTNAEPVKINSDIAESQEVLDEILQTVLRQENNPKTKRQTKFGTALEINSMEVDCDISDNELEVTIVNLNDSMDDVTLMGFLDDGDGGSGSDAYKHLENDQEAPNKSILLKSAMSSISSDSISSP